MAIDLAQLVVSLEANSAKFQKDMDRVNGKLDQFARNSKRTSDTVSAAFAGIRIGAIVAGLTAFVRVAANNVSQQRALAESVGLSVSAFSALNYAARQSELSQEDLGKAIFKINTLLADSAQGNEKAGKALARYGISVADVRSGVVGTDEALRKIADKFNKLPAGVNKSALAAELFGDKLGGRLIPFLNNGSKGLDEFAAKGEAAGAVMTDKVADAVAKANDKLAAFSQTLQTQVLVGLASLFGLVESFEGDKKIDDLSTEIQQLEFALRNLDAQATSAQEGGFVQFLKETFGATGDYAARIELVTRRLEALRIERDKLKSEQKDKLLSGDGGGKPSPIVPDVDTKELERLAQAEQKAADIASETASDYEFMMIAQRQKEREATAEYVAGWDEKVEAQRDAEADMAASYAGMNAMADQAARNIQSFTASLVDAALAGDDMGDVVVAALRRMAAEMLTLAILSKVMGTQGKDGSYTGGLLSGFLNGLAGKADGGPVSGGTPYMVGERGPELFVPRNSGTIVPNGAMGGGMKITQNIDARGADPASAANMLRALDASNRRLKAEIYEEQRRGYAPA